MGNTIESKAKGGGWHQDFPPKALCESGDVAALAKWFEAHAPPGVDILEGTPRERHLWGLSASAYVALRREGKTTCLEYCLVLVKRMLFYRKLNAFADSSYALVEGVIEQAREVSEKESGTFAAVWGRTF